MTAGVALVTDPRGAFWWCSYCGSGGQYTDAPTALRQAAEHVHARDLIAAWRPVQIAHPVGPP